MDKQGKRQMVDQNLRDILLNERESEYFLKLATEQLPMGVGPILYQGNGIVRKISGHREISIFFSPKNSPAIKVFDLESLMQSGIKLFPNKTHQKVSELFPYGFSLRQGDVFGVVTYSDSPIHSNVNTAFFFAGRIPLLVVWKELLRLRYEDT